MEGNRRMAARSGARSAVLRGAEPALPGWQGVRARCHDAECRLPSGTVLAPGVGVREDGDGRSVPVVGKVQFARRGGGVGLGGMAGMAAPASRAAFLLGLPDAHAACREREENSV